MPPKRKRDVSPERPLSPSKLNTPSSSTPKSKKSKSEVVLNLSPIDLASLTASARGLNDTANRHTEKVSRQLRSHYERIVHHYCMTQKILSDSSKAPLTRVRDVISWASKESHLEPPTDSAQFDALMAAVAPLLCAIAESPGTLDLDGFPEILTPVTEEELEADTELFQKFYLRDYTRTRKLAREEFVSYLERQPIDAGFATASMAAHGMADTANKVLPEVLRICGFSGAEFTVEDLPGPHNSRRIQTLYAGTTGNSVHHRNSSDMGSKPQSRLSHFLNEVDPDSIQIFELVPLRLKIDDGLDFRRKSILSDIERALVFCLSIPLNSAHGGFIPRYRPPPDIEISCKRIMQDLPGHVEGSEAPGLKSDLNKQIDEEVALIQGMRDKGEPVGPPISPEALDAVKENLTGPLRVVNGSVVSTWILKDVTREVFLAEITPGFFSEDMGRAMALLWDRLQLVSSYEGELEANQLRIRLGPFLDVWRIILIHRYWGLMVILLHLILSRMNPLFLVGFSAPVSHIFIRGTMVELVDEVEPQSVSTDLLKHPRIQALTNSPFLRDFQDHVGIIHIVSTGPKPQQISAFLPIVHPGREFYRPWLLPHLLRVGFLVTFKGVVAQRVFNNKASKVFFGTDAERRRTLLEQGKGEVEERLEVEGLETTLADWRKEMKDAETADTALRGKHVVNGELVKTGSGKPRCYANRETGSVAIGEPYSADRREQLDKLIARAKTAKLNGLPVFMGPGGSTPMDGLFAEWLLSRRKGVSLLWSANHYGRNLESFKVVENDKQRIALWNKATALSQRRADAAKYGSFRRSVFLKRTEMSVLDILRGRVSKFAQAIVVAVCDKCKEGDIGFGQNSRHRCKVEDDKKDSIQIKLGARDTDSDFEDYLRVCYFHDVMNHPITLDYLNEDDLVQFGVYSSLAREYLVDENDNHLSSLPTGIDVATVGEEVIWRRADTPPHVLLASAMDVAARTTAEYLEANNKDRGSGRPRRMAGSIYAPSQDKIWAQGFGDSLAQAIQHNPRKVFVSFHKEENCLGYLIRSANAQHNTRYQHSCTKNKGKVDQSEYNFWTASSFIDLPYCVMRMVIYKAIIEDDKQYKRILMW